jgi:hypothetical protein
MMNQFEGHNASVFSNTMAAFGMQGDSTTITPIKSKALCNVDSNSMAKRGKFVAVNDNDKCLTVGESKYSANKLASTFKSKLKPSPTQRTTSTS